jgi:hypothetical protein
MDNAKSKVEAPLVAQTLFGLTNSGLVLVGISGSIYKLVAPEGWVVQAYGQSLGLGAALVAALLGAAALVWALPGWTPGQRARIADVVVYGFAAAGLLYLGKLLLSGSF